MRTGTIIFLLVTAAVLLIIFLRDNHCPQQVADLAVPHARAGAVPPIDALLVWVDTRDPVWGGLKQKYQTQGQHHGSLDPVRLPQSPWSHFEVMQCVPLLLKNLPFIRHLVVVMMRPQTLPQELIDSLPPAAAAKIKYVYHDEYIPAQYLPTFNSTVIELFLHRIQALGEHFVYFNDDFYVIREMRPSHFFGSRETLGQQAAVPVVSCLKPTWAAAIPPTASSWLLRRFKLTHAAAHCFSHQVYRSTRAHRRYQTYHIRDHRPISLTKDMLHRAFHEVPQQVIHHTAQRRFRSADELLFLELALHVALDTKGAIHRPDPALLFSYESSRPLSKATVRAALASNASFVCFNALDIDNEEQRRHLLDILHPSHPLHDPMRRQQGV